MYKLPFSSYMYNTTCWSDQVFLSYYNMHSYTYTVVRKPMCIYIQGIHICMCKKLQFNTFRLYGLLITCSDIIIHYTHIYTAIESLHVLHRFGKQLSQPPINECTCTCKTAKSPVLQVIDEVGISLEQLYGKLSMGEVNNNLTHTRHYITCQTSYMSTCTAQVLRSFRYVCCE